MYINSLTISAQDALSKLSWLQLNTPWAIVIAILLAATLVPIGFTLSVHFNTPTIGGALIAVVLLLSLGIPMYLASLSDSEIQSLKDTPTKTISIKKYPIVSAQSASSKESSLSGNIFYVQGSSTDSTAYRYFVKTDNNIYQQHTLKEQFGQDIKAKNIYVKEDSQTKPMLVVKKVTYADKTIRRVLSNNGHSTTRTTYTFNVPKNSVVTDFNFK